MQEIIEKATVYTIMIDSGGNFNPNISQATYVRHMLAQRNGEPVAYFVLKNDTVERRSSQYAPNRSTCWFVSGFDSFVLVLAGWNHPTEFSFHEVQESYEVTNAVLSPAIDKTGQYRLDFDESGQIVQTEETITHLRKRKPTLAEAKLQMQKWLCEHIERSHSQVLAEYVDRPPLMESTLPDVTDLLAQDKLNDSSTNLVPHTGGELSTLLPEPPDNLHESSESKNREIPAGTQRDVVETRWERSEIARKQCIAYFGCRCQVCDFNFEERFGEIGRDFIHVHHLDPISNHDQTHRVDPTKDLIPLCPNCHAMIHRMNPPYTPDEIKMKMKSSNSSLKAHA